MSRNFHNIFVSSFLEESRPDKAQINPTSLVTNRNVGTVMKVTRIPASPYGPGCDVFVSREKQLEIELN
jgi:hypothetical protein